MKFSWHDEIFNLIDRVVKVKIPFEIIHFPSTGITSAINRYAEISKNDPESKLMCFVIDLRAAQFNHNPIANRNEFFRVLISHMEQYMDTKIEVNDTQTIFKTLNDIFIKYLQQKKTVLVSFISSAQINFNDVPEYRDLLIFLDKLRDHTGGKVNFILASTYPQFDDTNPAPIPLISQYFNYYKKPWIFSSVNECVLKDVPLGKHTNEQVEKLINLCGGMVAVVKSFVRDLVFNDKKFDSLDNLQVNKEFFDNYPNCKLEITRIFAQLKPDFIEAMIKLNNGIDIEEIDPKAKEYFQKTSIVDENNKIRGELISGFLKYQYKAPEQIKAKAKVAVPIEEKTVIVGADNDKFLTINSKLNVDKVSGEIYINSIPQSEYLTEKELTILTLLFNNRNQYVSREGMAELLWGKDAGSAYSDWAIDKLVSRTREKLHDSKPNRIIKTVRGRGFILIA